NTSPAKRLPFVTTASTSKVGEGVLEQIQARGIADVLVRLKDPVAMNAPSAQRMAAVAEVRNQVLSHISLPKAFVHHFYTHSPAIATAVDSNLLTAFVADPLVEFISLD